MGLFVGNGGHEMKRYEGRRLNNGICKVHVVVDGVSTPLDPRLDLANKSPTGFEWGYAGSGPAQLALAICADALGDDARALRLHQGFKMRVVVGLAQRQPWLLMHDTVCMICAAIERDLDRAGPRRTPQATFGRRAEASRKVITRRPED